jgi:hypothetical protein
MYMLWPVYAIVFPFAASFWRTAGSAGLWDPSGGGGIAEVLHVALLGMTLMATGVLTLQFSFAILHVTAHALFLEYDMIDSKDPRVSTKGVLHWIAFVHHHAPEHGPHSSQFEDSAKGRALFEKALTRFEKKNWAPHLNYHTEAGVHNVLMSHWSGFSTLSTWPRIVGSAVICWLAPAYGFWIVGYEVGVLFLPAAHAFQHLPASFFPSWLYAILQWLNRTGWFASAHDHKSHHDHKHPTVYQDFLSSGFYWRSLDTLVNSLWDRVFLASSRDIGKRPHDTWAPIVNTLIVVTHFFLPLAIILIYT